MRDFFRVHFSTYMKRKEGFLTQCDVMAIGKLESFYPVCNSLYGWFLLSNR
jgi:hypothetical protein